MWSFHLSFLLYRRGTQMWCLCFYMLSVKEPSIFTFFCRFLSSLMNKVVMFQKSHKEFMPPLLSDIHLRSSMEKRIFLGWTWKLKDFLLTEILPKSTRQLAATLHLVQSLLLSRPPTCPLQLALWSVRFSVSLCKGHSVLTAAKHIEGGLTRAWFPSTLWNTWLRMRLSDQCCRLSS